MRLSLSISLTLLAALSGESLAACTGTQLTDAIGLTETAKVTFKTIKNKDTVTVAGLTYTATSNTTAAAVAVFFGGKSVTGWTASNASGADVTYTSITPNSNVTDIVVSATANTGDSSAITPSVTTTQGISGGTLTLSGRLGGSTVCVGSPGNWKNQEYHTGSTGGNVIDWKKGASDPIDPTSTVGTWSITGTGTTRAVSYSYGSSTYTFKVYDQGSGIFCFDGPSTFNAYSIKSGQSACP